MISGIAWKSLFQWDALAVSSRKSCSLFLESGACFKNLALAIVSYNAVDVERTQNPEGRGLRGAPLLAAKCLRQNDRYVCAHVRETTDDTRRGLCLAGWQLRSVEGVYECQPTTLQLA